MQIVSLGDNRNEVSNPISKEKIKMSSAEHFIQQVLKQ